MNSTQISLTNASATAIVNNTTASQGSANYPMAVAIKNPTGGEAVYLGPSSVTTGSGFLLSAGETLTVDVINEPLFAIVQTGPQTVYVLRRG